MNESNWWESWFLFEDRWLVFGLFILMMIVLIVGAILNWLWKIFRGEK